MEVKKTIERTLSFLTEKIVREQVNSSCFSLFYQEQIPERAVQKYKKKEYNVALMLFSLHS